MKKLLLFLMVGAFAYGAYVPYSLTSKLNKQVAIFGRIDHSANSTCTATGTGFSTSCSTVGIVSVTFTTNFSSAPYCVVGLAANSNDVSCRSSSILVSGFTDTCANAAGTGSNVVTNFICIGAL